MVVVSSSARYERVISYLAPLVEAQVAGKLIESIRGKKEARELLEIIESLPSVNPELSLDRNSKTIKYLCHSLYRISWARNCSAMARDLSLVPRPLLIIREAENFFPASYIIVEE